MESSQKTILITGASSGIGRATAELLAQRGDTVYAGARKQADIEELGQISGITPIRLDITSQTDIADAFSQIRDAKKGLDGLVNNAGVNKPGPLMDLPDDILRQQFETNVVGLHNLTRTFFPLLLDVKGRIVNVSSAGGKVAFPFLGPYHISKYSAEAYSDSLRRELLPYDIKVCVIQPGNVRTPIWDKVDIEDPLFTNSLFKEQFQKFARFLIEEGKKNALPPARIAEVIFQALHAKKPKIRYLVTEGNLRYRFMFSLPGRMVDGQFKKNL